MSLLDEIGRLAGKAYVLAIEEKFKRDNEVEELAEVLRTTYLATENVPHDANDMQYWRNRATAILNAGYRKV
jgi:hypothetical protein